MNFFMIDNTSICKICSNHCIVKKKRAVNSILKIMIEKKRNNETGEDVHGEIKLMRMVIKFGEKVI